MLKNAVLDVEKFADGAENELFEVPAKGRRQWRSLTITSETPASPDRPSLAVEGRKPPERKE